MQAAMSHNNLPGYSIGDYHHNHANGFVENAHVMRHSPVVDSHQNHTNGFAENGFSDHGAARLYDLIEKAESALSNQQGEVERLRTALETSQRELALLRRNSEEAQSRVLANSNSEHQRGVDDVNFNGLHLSPPSRPLSPSRRNNTEERPQEPKKQDMMLTLTKPLEEENRQLRTQLLETRLRNSQLVSENNSLERKITELQALYHQEQQSVVDATAKALSMREELVDKNMKLAYENQALGQERSIFVSSLLPLLEEFDLHPPPDAQPIVNSLKALVQYLKMNNERRLMEAQVYRHVYAQPPPNNNMQSPPRFISAPSPPPSGREIVPQGYNQPASPSSPLNGNNILHHEEMTSPLATHGNSELVTRENGFQNGFQPIETEEANNFNQGEYMRRLPTLLEEPSHLAPEGDDDPLPAVAGLRIVGDAILGSKLTVCGHSINGTSLCNFQWIRYYPDGAPEDIDGASQTEYTLSADDIDTFIAIQCCPMDDRQRKGEQVTEFANSQNVIKIDQTLEDQIHAHIMASQAHFDVSVMVENDNWESGVLLLKRGSYEIKKNGIRLVKEHYSSDVNVRVVVGQYIQCAIVSMEGRDYMLSFKENRVRDRAVLTLRRFKQLALEGKRVKGKSWFGKKTG